MNLSLETISTVIGVLLGLGAVATAIYRYWGLPDRMEKVEKGQASRDVDCSSCGGLVDQKVKASSDATRTEMIRVQTAQVQKLEEFSALHHASRAELFVRLNALQDQITANKLEASTAMTAIREIQNGIRDRFQAIGRVEDLVGSALLANAEKKAEISRLKDDYQQLSDLVQRLNREIGELSAGVETREARKRQ